MLFGALFICWRFWRYTANIFTVALLLSLYLNHGSSCFLEIALFWIFEFLEEFSLFPDICRLGLVHLTLAKAFTSEWEMYLNAIITINLNLCNLGPVQQKKKKATFFSHYLSMLQKMPADNSMFKVNNRNTRTRCKFKVNIKDT